MPRLNRNGEWCAGVGGGVASWGDSTGTGTVIAGAMAPAWVTSDVVVVQVCAPDCILQTVNVRTTTAVTVAPRGANVLSAGGGVWAAWLGGYGVFASTPLAKPDAWLGTVGPDAAIALKRLYQSSGPWDVHERTGAVWSLTAGDAQGVQLLGSHRAVWTEAGEPHTAGPCPTPNPMTRPYYHLRMIPPSPASDPDGWWCLYQDSTERLLLHPATSASGYVVAPAGSATYGPDLLRLSASTIRVVWSTTAGEAPADIVVSDVDLAATREVLGTAVPPTWTEPAGRGGRTYPPYQQPILDRGGRVSTPWHRFFLTLASTTANGESTLPAGSVSLDQLQPIDSPRLLGRGSDGTGPVEQITIGLGLALTGTELAATAAGISGLGYWTPITNGDPLSPEILFDAEGDCVVGFVPTPEAA